LALSMLYVWSLRKPTIFYLERKKFSQESATSTTFLTAIF
jgi:hypothetical protein